MTVGVWLEHWLATVVPGRASSPNTLTNYRAVVRHQLKPALGKVVLAKLNPEQVDRFLASRAEAGFSRSYVARMRAVLTDALRHAERRGLVHRNAGALSVMPKTGEPSERRSLTADEARSLIEAARPERLSALVVLGLTIGLRPGELSGLLWDDLDLQARPPVLVVSGSLKRQPDSALVRGAVKRSSAGERTIELPGVAAKALRHHWRQQAAERLAAGDVWADTGLVFTSETGSALDPSNVRRVFRRIAERAGIDDMDFPYVMRHTVASLLLDAGASIEEVADVLGDDPRTLYRHYRHRVRPVASAAARPMQALFGSGS